MKRKSIFAAVAALMFALAVMPACSQAVLARVTGKVTEGSTPLAGAQVILTHTDSGRKYKLKTDKNGEFSQIGLTRGLYELEIINAAGESVFKKNTPILNEGGTEDHFLIDIKDAANAKLGAGAVATGTSKTKEKAAETEAAKKEREAAIEHNKKAESENALIAQLNPALQAQNWQVAEPLLQQLSTINPTRWEYLQALGNAQLNLGKYEEALATFGKAVPLAQNGSDPKADPAKAKAAAAQMLTSEGNAYLKLKKNPEAIEAFNKAAELSPNPGTAYFNICATQYNTGNMEGASVACDKAIAADPNKADAYFIKGSSMYGSGKLDAQNKYTVPPGTAEALKKYLELAPDGAHAADVKAMLEAIGAKIETTYKERKKK